MWPEKFGEYRWFGKHKKNGYSKRKQSKGCSGNKRNDSNLIKSK